MLFPGLDRGPPEDSTRARDPQEGEVEDPYAQEPEARVEEQVGHGPFSGEDREGVTGGGAMGLPLNS
jgi:hypothetical protein